MEGCNRGRRQASTTKKEEKLMDATTAADTVRPLPIRTCTWKRDQDGGRREEEAVGPLELRAAKPGHKKKRQGTAK